MYDGCAAYPVRRFPRPSPSVFAYWKRSKAGGVEGLGTRLRAVAIAVSVHMQLTTMHVHTYPTSGNYTSIMPTFRLTSIIYSCHWLDNCEHA